MFSDLHSSLAPPKPPRSFSESIESNMENLSAPKSEKRQAPLPPGYIGGSSSARNGRQDSKNTQRPPLPLPDYETLFPKKRHGVMSQTRWDHIIAEVNQRNWDFSEEMNVDGPNKSLSNSSAVLKDRTSANLNQLQRNHEPLPPVLTRPKEALKPPKVHETSEPTLKTTVQHDNFNESVYATVNKPGKSKNFENNPHPAVQHLPQDMERKTPDGITYQPSHSIDKPTPASRVKQNINPKTEDVAKQMPSAKPRQQSLVKDPVRQVEPDQHVTTQTVTSENNKAEKSEKGQKGSVFTSKSHLRTSEVPENLGKLSKDPDGSGMINTFPSDNVGTEDPWAFIPQQTTDEEEVLFTKGPTQLKSIEDQELSYNKNLAKKDNSMAPKSESEKQAPSFTEQARATFQRNFSLRKKNPSHLYTTPGKAGTESSSLDRSISQSSQDAEDVEMTVTSIASSSRTESTPETSQTPTGGKTALRAWVSPSESQTYTLQSGSGNAVSSSKRPHPVKPMSTTENQSPSVLAVGKEPKTITIKEMAKSKNCEGSPYTQLTQEELITLVVKQQGELSSKDSRILELEEYIDNLLLRVIEEKPEILLTLHSKC